MMEKPGATGDCRQAAPVAETVSSRRFSATGVASYNWTETFAGLLRSGVGILKRATYKV